MSVCRGTSGVYMIFKIFQSDLDNDTSVVLNIKQFSLLGNKVAVLLEDSSFRFFNADDVLIEIIDKN